MEHHIDRAAAERTALAEVGHTELDPAEGRSLGFEVGKVNGTPVAGNPVDSLDSSVAGGCSLVVRKAAAAVAESLLVVVVGTGCLYTVSARELD